MTSSHSLCEFLKRRKATGPMQTKGTSLHSLLKEPEDPQRSCHSSFGPGSRQLRSPGKEGGKPRERGNHNGKTGLKPRKGEKFVLCTVQWVIWMAFN